MFFSDRIPFFLAIAPNRRRLRIQPSMSSQVDQFCRIEHYTIRNSQTAPTQDIPIHSVILIPLPEYYGFPTDI